MSSGAASSSAAGVCQKEFYEFATERQGSALSSMPALFDLMRRSGCLNYREGKVEPLRGKKVLLIGLRFSLVLSKVGGREVNLRKIPLRVKIIGVVPSRGVVPSDADLKAYVACPDLAEICASLDPETSTLDLLETSGVGYHALQDHEVASPQYDECSMPDENEREPRLALREYFVWLQNRLKTLPILAELCSSGRVRTFCSRGQLPPEVASGGYDAIVQVAPFPCVLGAGKLLKEGGLFYYPSSLEGERESLVEFGGLYRFSKCPSPFVKGMVYSLDSSTAVYRQLEWEEIQFGLIKRYPIQLIERVRTAIRTAKIRDVPVERLFQYARGDHGSLSAAEMEKIMAQVLEKVPDALSRTWFPEGLKFPITNPERGLSLLHVAEIMDNRHFASGCVLEVGDGAPVDMYGLSVVDYIRAEPGRGRASSSSAR